MKLQKGVGGRVRVLPPPRSHAQVPPFLERLSAWLQEGETGQEVLCVANPKALENDLDVKVPPGPHLILPTSGSSGHPRLVLLSQRALRASAEATNAVLAGPGSWALLLPLAHIAGVQVALRALAAGAPPLVPPSWPKPDLAEVSDQMLTHAESSGQRPFYTSLVSAQLARLVGASDQTLEGFRVLDAILVGGGRIDPALLETARSLGLKVTTTYGMTETCGGCVYNGLPLPGTQLDVDANGQVLISSSSLMYGYLNEGAQWAEIGGKRYWKTGDLGRLGEDGCLHITGRADRVIKSGGEKVDLGEVERALGKLQDVREVACIPLEDPHWGNAIGALLVAEPGTAPDPAWIYSALKDSLGPSHAPRAIALVSELPRSALGKVRLARLVSLMAEEIQQGRAWTRGLLQRS